MKIIVLLVGHILFGVGAFVLSIELYALLEVYK